MGAYVQIIQQASYYDYKKKPGDLTARLIILLVQEDTLPPLYGRVIPEISPPIALILS